MTDISVKGIVKAFEEDNDILKGLTFEIAQGEHVGLLGKNGAGKTTLFRIISGEIGADEGEVVIATGKRVGLISQIPHFPEGYTAEDVLKTAHARAYGLREQMEKLAERMVSDSSPEVLNAYDRAAAEYERLGGYELESYRNKVANGLRIPQDQREQLFDTLSGGEKTRVNLARLILEDTDILLLDEPTNHLDMRAAEWLEDYLAKFKGTVLAISHDRYFLDRMASRTIEIVDGKAEFYGGNYSFFLAEKERRFLEQQKKYEREQSEIKRLSESAARLYQWGTGNKNLMKKSFAIQSRIERMEKTARPDAEKKMRARFGEKSFRGDEVILMRGVTKTFGEKNLFEDLELLVTTGERIALIGDNGSGKSTLLKIIMQEELPDRGFVRLGPAVKTAYLPQVIKFRHPERNVLDTMVYDENCSPQTARNRLGAFKFSGEDVFRPVSQLSGGEQSRLRLCILMKEDINLLILDEPTNHLDINSREWIEGAVEDYQEALLFVSHDRYFINRFATRIWEIENGKLTDFMGTFEEYRSYKAGKTQETPPTSEEKKPEKKQDNRKRGAPSPEKLLAKLEREIAALEEKQKELEDECEKYASDYEKLLELDAALETVLFELSEKYADWEELAE
ncbi:MAG: ribosomal protection-like ABC-F family protein [Oscillospiraceae bacterium]